LLTVDHFYTFFTSRLCKKFATQWHAHYFYYVATLPCKNTYSKTNIIYRPFRGKFLKYLTAMLNMSYNQCPKVLHSYKVSFYLLLE